MRSSGVKRLTLSALLVTVMLMLGYVESLIPTGVPGIKLGLSNSVLILAICWLGVPNAFLLMLVKVFLSGFLFSGVSAILYALAGGVLSMLTMILLLRVGRFHPVATAMGGAVMHNVGQVLMAMWILRTKQLLYYMAVLMLVGLATGFVTGMIASVLLRRLPRGLLPKDRDDP